MKKRRRATPVVMARPTLCEVRYAPSLRDRDHDMPIRHHLPMLSVPLVGEVVSIDGHPYKTVERSWSLGDERDPATYCTLRVVNLVDADPPWLVELAKKNSWHRRYIKAWRNPDPEEA